MRAPVAKLAARRTRREFRRGANAAEPERGPMLAFFARVGGSSSPAGPAKTVERVNLPSRFTLGPQIEGCPTFTRKREREMTRALLVLVVVFFSTLALADKPVPPAEAEKIKATMQAWGCSGGKMEQEAEASGIYEVDDAKCKDGQYDIKLDKEFKIILISRD
jgi:hypothetical protein